MFGNGTRLDVTLICGSTDMRKSIDGLSNIVAYELQQEPCNERLFVFCNQRRNKLKILQWAANGFWLHYKRLELATFDWPGIEDEQLSLQISSQQLDWLLAGLPLTQPQAHPRLCYHYHDL
ncbi:IS66 family insertion sequence element accessory protein TnpB [Shewanella sp. SP2S2-4]|uniref:IS66 family insertion sequence element accessory protein TnpB n=1 Tax=Shewanella sp. SP2S2-4 TaxID=3063539 RepID=UPI00289011A8|nr:IS66 family insertion sequence element accessory protein TnpB [Shewanella sp. SP2S2-4]MDT3275843.1 IS66 family insertion sequence element accessory protein TnpB [Shewanella sp. SP2S2-4]